MGHFGLAIPGLREEWAQLRRGGLYWLDCAQAEDAEMLARQLLAGLDPAARASLVVGGGSPQALLAALGADEGPGELWPYAFAVEDAAALRQLGRELQRRRHAPRGQLIVLLAPGACWDVFAGPRLEAWCVAQRAWLAAADCCLLVLSHGPAADLGDRLLACNEPLSGLAALAHRDGGLHYQLHFWRNALGVQAAVEAPWLRGGAGFVCLGERARGDASPAASDRHLYLAERSVLEGAPPLSEHWRLFDDAAALLAAAGGATAACAIFAIGDNAAVPVLAERLYRLRQRRGRALRLVVRESAACLRYLDERLLLACGASLIVPAGTGLSRFLGLLDSLSGQLWTRSLPDDLPALLKRLRPPPQRGLLPGGEFAALVGELLGGGDGELDHLLLRLTPLPGLALAQVLGQCRLRRAGDLACVAGGELWLFLFACRGDGLELALGHIFRLPWRELFAGLEVQRDGAALARALAEPGEELPALPAAVPLPGRLDPAATAPHLSPVRVGAAGLRRLA